MSETPMLPPARACVRTAFEYLGEAVEIDIGGGRRVKSTVRERLGELMARNQGADMRVWPGVGVVKETGQVLGLTPVESMQLQKFLGTLDGLKAAAGNLRADDEALAREIADAMREADAKMRETSLRQMLLAPGPMPPTAAGLRARRTGK